MTQATLAHVPISDIHIEEGFNPRQEIDETNLAGLAESVDDGGVRTPIALRKGDDGLYYLVAGHRRYEAARISGVQTLPAIIRSGTRAEALLDALIENLHREDLNPIDTALGLKALAGEFELTSNKAIAEKVKGVTARWVGEHLRLLELPPGCRSLIAAGVVPVKAEKVLREVAAVSPRVAECVCEYAQRKQVKSSRFIEQFEELLTGTAQARFTDRPTMIHLSHATQLSDLVPAAKQRKELAGRLDALVHYELGDDPRVELGDEEVDAARAAGCLIELRVDQGEWVRSVLILTDAELAVDLTVHAVERREQEVAARQSSEAEQKQQQLDSPEAKKEKETRKAERAEREARKEKAIRDNDRAGRNLLERKTPGKRKERSLPRAKAIAHMFIEQNPHLAAAGLRLLLTQLQEVETKTLKSGEPRSKTHYATPEQSTEWLRGRADAARSANEVFEVLTDAVIAGHVADDAVLTQAERIRIRWSPAARGKTEELLGEEIKEVGSKRKGGKRR